MAKNSFASASICLACFFAAMAASLAWPAFDLDEALYVRIAQEMRLTEHWIVPHWDGVPFLDKPPLYLWLVAAAQHAYVLVAGGSSAALETGVGLTAASRIPSLVCAVLTALLLATEARRLRAPGGAAFGLLAYFTFLLPLAGIGLVLFDAPLTLALCVALLCWRRALARENRFLSLRATLAVGVALGLAVCLKGLVGLVLPLGALGLHALSRRAGAWWPATLRAARLAVPALALASVLAAAHFAFIGANAGGPAFLRHFFIEEHFGRGLSAREGHGGPFLYHFACVLLLGGGGLALLARLGGSLSAAWSREDVRLAACWAVFVPLFFGLMATKLPNYTWPIWPALSLLLVDGVSHASVPLHPAQRISQDSAQRALARPFARTGRLSLLLARALGLAPAYALAIVGVTLVVATLLVTAVGGELRDALAVAASLSPTTLPSLDLAQRLLSDAPRLDLSNAAALAAAGVCFVGVSLAVFRRAANPNATIGTPVLMRVFILQALAVTFLGIGAAPLARLFVERPWTEISSALTRQGIASSRVATLGWRSPTASRFLRADGGPLHQWNTGVHSEAGEGVRASVDGLVVPAWKPGLCEEHGHLPIARSLHLQLCLVKEKPLASSNERARAGDAP